MYCIVYVFVAGKLQAKRRDPRHMSQATVYKYIYRHVYLELEPIIAIAGVSISVGSSQLLPKVGTRS
jgi:hypothetical protein